MTISNLTASGSGTNASSYTTASITPTANALILAAIETDQGTPPPTKPTLSGNGLTWVEVIDCYYDQAGTSYRLTVFRALGASPSAGAVTIDYGGVTQGGCAWTIDEFTGVDTSGTNGSGAIVQSAKTAEPGSAATSITATLGGAITSGNGAYSAASWEANETGNAETANGWVKLGQGGHAGPSGSVVSQYRTDNTDNSATTSWTTSITCGAVIIEVKAAASGTIHEGAATLAGSGTIAATGQAIAQASAALAGTGNLAVSGQAIAQGAATLAGVGTLAADGQVIAQAVAVLAGAGSLAAAGTVESSNITHVQARIAQIAAADRSARVSRRNAAGIGAADRVFVVPEDDQ